MSWPACMRTRRSPVCARPWRRGCGRYGPAPGARCRAKPALRLVARRRDCRFVAAVRGADADAIERVEFLVRRRPRGDGGATAASFRRLARDASAPVRRLLRPAGVLPGRRLLLRARVSLDDGRAVTLDRRLRACR